MKAIWTILALPLLLTGLPLAAGPAIAMDSSDWFRVEPGLRTGRVSAL